MNTGYINSGINPLDRILSATPNIVFESYNIKNNAEVFNQGIKGSCVSCAITEIYNYVCKTYKKPIDIDFEYIYNKREDKSIDGMTPREGFSILRAEDKIKDFARIGSSEILKQSIMANGPALIALPVYSNSTEFWLGNDYLGGHAVAVVGYNKNNFIIKNSWGKSYGNNGYAELSIKDFNKAYECWTVLN